MFLFAAKIGLVSPMLRISMIEAAKLSAEDLVPLVGKPWKGSLTYLDYQSNKKTTILSNLIVTTDPKDKMSWTFDIQYPDEPKANGKQKVSITENGSLFDGETVVSRSQVRDTLTWVTAKDGVDNNRKAKYRYTYTLSPKSFTIRKEVRVEGSDAYFERNTYTWKR